jgi:hypothetical protein
MAHLDACHVSNRVLRPWCATNGEFEVVFARFLRIQRTRKRKDADNHEKNR